LFVHRGVNYNLEFLEEALNNAHVAANKDMVPVDAVIMCNNEIHRKRSFNRIIDG